MYNKIEEIDNVRDIWDPVWETALQMEMKELRKQGKIVWVCPRCGHRNSYGNKVCMGSEMGDGRCGCPKPDNSIEEKMEKNK